MYAVFIEVNADESHTDQAREVLPKTIAPQARESGAKGGYWLAPQNGRGVSVTVYEDEATARAVAERLTIGEEVGEVAGVTWRTVEVREVLAHL
jgi:hypothetical protein